MHWTTSLRNPVPVFSRGLQFIFWQVQEQLVWHPGLLLLHRWLQVALFPVCLVPIHTQSNISWFWQSANDVVVATCLRVSEDLLNSTSTSRKTATIPTNSVENTIVRRLRSEREWFFIYSALNLRQIDVLLHWNGNIDMHSLKVVLNEITICTICTWVQWDKPIPPLVSLSSTMFFIFC